MPIKEKFDDRDCHEDEDLALTLLANYTEGLEEKQKKKQVTKKSIFNNSLSIED